MPRIPRWAAAAEPPVPAVSAPAIQFGSGDQCVLGIAGTVSLGPNTGQPFQGTLTISVGQATGRSIRLRVGSDPSTAMTFVGSGVFPVDQCSGDFSGAFAGPGVQNVGVWVANESQGA